MKKLVAYIFLITIVYTSVHALPQCKGENKYKIFKSKKWHKCIGIEKKDEHKYEGEFKNGEFDGQGTFFLNNGDKYIGEWKNGLQEGHGIYTSADTKFSFNGEWKKGKRMMGITKYSDGKIVSEIYVNDKKINWRFKKDNPDGSYTTINSEDKYVGEFKNGFEHGKGTFITSDNNKKYSGEFKYGFKHGKGSLALYETDSHLPHLFYDGEWKYDQKNGHGEEEYKNGSKHIGNFINGKIEGDGIFSPEYGGKCFGYWKDEFVSLSSIDQTEFKKISGNIKTNEFRLTSKEKKKDKEKDKEEIKKITEEIKKITEEINELKSELPVLSANCDQYIK